MKTTRKIRLTCLLAATAVLLPGGVVLADESVRTYTNADLTIAPSSAMTFTNADLAKLKPIPQQGAPIVPKQAPPSAAAPQAPAMQGWELVFAVLDRERAAEKARHDHELALATAAAQMGQGYYGDGRAGYGSLFPYGSGFCTGNDCGLGPAIVRTPTNPYQSLDQRGVRTAEDLFRESVANTRVRRQALP